MWSIAKVVVVVAVCSVSAGIICWIAKECHLPTEEEMALNRLNQPDALRGPKYLLTEEDAKFITAVNKELGR